MSCRPGILMKKPFVQTTRHISSRIWSNWSTGRKHRSTGCWWNRVLGFLRPRSSYHGASTFIAKIKSRSSIPDQDEVFSYIKDRSLGDLSRLDHSDRTYLQSALDGLSLSRVASARRNLLDPMALSGRRKAVALQTLSIWSRQHFKIPIRRSVSWILPFIHLHHVEIENSACERYRAPSCQTS